ncbi:MAG TPA: translation initiation factor IF-2 [Vicinamibacterales bacterium]|nr:translation initiation factor IF-2 [Vicinamibacterales bacterium]
MATVRIYKIAELLNMSSQDVVTLLRKESGIEVKSASSTIEEVVAASFVERKARERKITLPGKSQRFADTPATKPGAKKGGKGAKAPEPPPPPAPTLRPRLIKTVKPAPVAEETPAEAEADTQPESPAHEPQEPAQPEVAAAATEAAAVETREESEPVEAEPAREEAEAERKAPAASETSEPAAAAPAAPPRASRVVPPSIRLRIEDPATGQAPAARPTVPRQPIRQPAQPPAPSTRAPQAPTGNLARPGVGARPGMPSSRPPLGGPRPLPSQPVRPPSAQRPGMSGARPPYQPQFRPGGGRPFGQRGGGGGSKRSRDHDRGSSAVALPPPPPVTRSVTLAEGMTVKDLAEKLDVKVKDVMLKLMQRRMMMTINTTLDTDTAQMIAREFGADVEMRTFEEELTEEAQEASSPENIVTRAPVVTVMGHVDHGKTTLLDSIRETTVAEKEAGGITQHIGAYAVQVRSGAEGSGDRKVVFLDTPGHEAFTMMRARGARVTDVVILVVAADDGVMPQTKEAIDHAKAAGVPMIVAINKIDKPGANPERVKRELTDLGYMPEEWGGQTVMVEVSAKQKKNLEQLLEMVLLVTDIGELKADPSRYATGTVLEAKVDRGRGPVATVLVQNGTLRVGDDFLAGTVVGRVRALIDDRGRPTKEAPPSTPVEVLGLTSLPSPGDTFQAVEDTAKARQIAQFRQSQAKDKALGAKGGRLTLESLQAQMAEGGMKELPVIIKADVQGSAEVLASSLTKISDERVKIKIIHTGVGAINESDVLLASASNAIIIGFNVKPDRNAADVAEREEVDIRFHTVIYNVTDEMKKAMTGLLEPTLKEAKLGTAEVRQVFKAPKIGTIAGCMVTDGRIIRSGDAQARLLRDGAVVWTGKIASLKRFKDDVAEVTKGFECGIGLANFNDIKAGDVIEAFSVEKIAGTM